MNIFDCHKTHKDCILNCPQKAREKEDNRQNFFSLFKNFLKREKIVLRCQVEKRVYIVNKLREGGE